MEKINSLLDDLRRKGFRITQARKRLLGLLEKGKTPLSVFDLQKSLGLAVNKTTMYRELEFLKKNGIVQEVEFGDKKKRYEISSSHHHHVVCVECKSVKDVELQKDLDAEEKKIAKQKGFKIINHSLEFFGLCPACR